MCFLVTLFSYTYFAKRRNPINQKKVQRSESDRFSALQLHKETVLFISFKIN